MAMKVCIKGVHRGYINMMGSRTCHRSILGMLHTVLDARPRRPCAGTSCVRSTSTLAAHRSSDETVRLKYGLNLNLQINGFRLKWRVQCESRCQFSGLRYSIFQCTYFATLNMFVLRKG